MPGLSGAVALAGGSALPPLRTGQVLAGAGETAGVRGLRLSSFGDGGDDLPGHENTPACLVPRHVVGHYAEERRKCPGTSTRAMVRPDRDLLTGAVEVDEGYLGGLEEGLCGRLIETKAIIVVAAQEEGRGIGRIRMRRIPDASAASLESFLQEAVQPGSRVHTDGWSG